MSHVIFSVQDDLDLSSASSILLLSVSFCYCIFRSKMPLFRKCPVSRPRISVFPFASRVFMKHIYDDGFKMSGNATIIVISISESVGFVF